MHLYLATYVHPSYFKEEDVSPSPQSNLLEFRSSKLRKRPIPTIVVAVLIF